MEEVKRKLIPLLLAISLLVNFVLGINWLREKNSRSQSNYPGGKIETGN